jgi:hypothetical protein
LGAVGLSVIKYGSRPFRGRGQFSYGEGRYLLSISVLILFVLIYDRFSKPINRLQTEAAKTRRALDNARGLQLSWDRSLMIRVPLLAICMIAQFVALTPTSA